MYGTHKVLGTWYIAQETAIKTRFGGVERRGWGRGLLLLLLLVVLIFTRTIKSVVTQAPVTLERRNIPGNKHNAKSGYTHTW